MTAWHRGPMLAFDTETTAPDPEAARVVTATCAAIRPGQAPEVTTWLVNPGCDIPEGATAVHGITTERAQKHGQDPAAALSEIATHLAAAITQGVPLVLFNAAFDLTLLDREFTRHGIDLDLTQALVADGLVLDKAVDRYRKGKRTLTAVCEHYKVSIDGAHDATADALAAARVVWRIAEQYPDVVQVPLDQLHAKQASWRAEQCASLEAYFRRKDPTVTVPGDWPVLPARKGAAASP